MLARPIARRAVDLKALAPTAGAGQQGLAVFQSPTLGVYSQSLPATGEAPLY